MITKTDNRTRLAMSGTTYDFDFRIDAETELEVYGIVDNGDGTETATKLTTGFSMSFDTADEEGTVTFDAEPTDYDYILMLRNKPYEQAVDVPIRGGFSEADIERALDALCIQIQQLKEITDYCVKLDLTKEQLDIVLPTPEDGHALVWDGTDGTMANSKESLADIEAAVEDLDQAVTAAQAAQAAAELAQAAAEEAAETENTVDYSNTSTITGWSSFSTKLIWITSIGKLRIVRFYIEGTSGNATTRFTVPDAASSVLGGANAMARAKDNGSFVDTLAFCQISLGATLVACFKDSSAGAWTSSGTKFVSGVLIYATD
ncbi:MAG: hypothetical protein GX567_19395 [Clostridia bacterium]|nr:hypothetical protein [Clostridia bacterium]